MSNNNEELVQELIRDGYLKTPSIIEAFRKIDRGEFVPDEARGMAYVNEPLPIGSGQTISQPLTVAFMFELLQPKSGEKILDIGCGSGWTTALLSHIAARDILDLTAPNVNPRVVGIELIPELAEMAARNIDKFGFIGKHLAEVVSADASQGIEPKLLPVGGFDKIIAAASAQEIPLEWKRQLAVGGRIVAPVGDSIVLVEKHGGDKFKTTEFPGFRFVPLVTGGEKN